MNTPLDLAISLRYEGLSGGSCCLSCGGAVDLAEPRAGEVCLDHGSGRGHEVQPQAEALGPDGFAYGVDLTSAMVDRARRTAEKLGITNARFLRADLAAIDLPNASVDLVISNCTINHAGDKAAVWREIARLLKPGGRFVVSDIYALEEVPDMYRNDPEAVAECWAGAVTRHEYLDVVEGAGFEAVRWLEESAPYMKGRIQVASFTLFGRKPKPWCG